VTRSADRSTDPTPHPAQRFVAPTPPRSQPWRWQHYVAVIGCLFLAWGIRTVLAWLAAGPAPVTAYRDPASSAYNISKVYEVVAVLLGDIVKTCGWPSFRPPPP
jgi:hypothetical protein